MASPVAPPPLPPPAQQRSFAGPVVLIVLGLLFLMGTMGVLHWKPLLVSFGRFWPLLLIIWGVIKLLEYKQAERAGLRPRSIGVGGAFLVIFLVVTGLIATQATRVNWDALRGEIGIDDSDFDPFGQSYSFNDELSEAFPAGGTLHVNNERGDVTVTVSSDDKIHVDVRKKIRADKQEDADKYNPQTKPDIVVSGKTVTVNANTERAGEHGVVADLDISIPRKADVFIDSKRGNVEVSDREGNLQISASRGSISLDDIAGNASLSVSGSSVKADKISGDLSIDGRAKEVSISDVKGSARLNGEFMESVRLSKIDKTVIFRSSRTDMEFSKLDGELDLNSDDLRATSLVGPVRLITRSKDIRLEDVIGDLRLQDSNGGVDVSFRTLGSVQIDNRKGDIEIAIPAKSGFHIEARNRGGEIDTDFPELKVETVRDDNSLNGSVGSGGPRIIINSEHGTISLRRASTVPPPEPPAPPVPTKGPTPKSGTIPKTPPTPPVETEN
jgi:hypothetical protein